MSRPLILEVCVDSAEAAVAAAAAGAHRIELCANLVEGGTTPSAGSIETAVADSPAAVMVMIRPRGGDFAYRARELEIMRRDIEIAGERGAAGVVFGCLSPDGDVEARAASALIAAARPMQVTFHRAFDLSRDPFAALETLIDLGCDRVLTSGQAPTAPEGIELITALVGRAAGRLAVMPGVGIDAGNAVEVAVATGAGELHVYTEKQSVSPMRFRRRQIPMGRDYRPDEYVLTEPDCDAIAAIAAALQQFAG